MVIVALSKKGRGFLYKPTTAHEVLKKDAERIAQALNTETRFAVLKQQDEEWTVHEVDVYDNAFGHATRQRYFFQRLRPYSWCGRKIFSKIVIIRGLQIAFDVIQ